MKIIMLTTITITMTMMVGIKVYYIKQKYEDGHFVEGENDE